MNYFITDSLTQDLYGLTKISLAECATILLTQQEISIDVETTGLSYLDDNLLMLQISTYTDNFVIDCQTVDPILLKGVMESKDILKIGHNLSFDIKFLITAGMRCEKVYCTFLTEKVINCGRDMRFALKDLLHRYKGLDMSKETRSTFIGHRGDFTKAQVVYGIKDTEYLLGIRKEQMQEATQKDLHIVIRLENEALLAFTDMEYNGMSLDVPVWNELAKLSKKEVKELGETLDANLIQSNPEYMNRQIDLFGGARVATISWTSPKQVLGLFKKYESSLESVGADVLAEYKYHIPLIKNYITYKEQSKLSSAYGIAFYKYLLSDNKIHTNFNQIMNTGRVSSRSPNMQQIPSRNEYRNAFLPNDPDHVFVSSDFGAQELCIIAKGSKDPVFLKVLREGGDLHSVCAKLVFGDRWDNANDTDKKVMRTQTKTITFALCYGAGAFTIGRNLEIAENHARALIKNYFKAFPKIEKYLKELGDYGKRFGFVRTFPPFKRVRYFPEWSGKQTPKRELSKLMRASKNTVIQGSAADQTKTALILVRNEIKLHNLPVKLVLAVHDEINTTCQKDYAPTWGKRLAELMMDAAEMNMNERLIKCDVTVSERWQK